MLVRMDVVELKKNITVGLETDTWQSNKTELYRLIKYVSDNKSNLCIDCIDDEDCFVAFSFRNDYEKNKLYIILDEYAKERKMFLQSY